MIEETRGIATADGAMETFICHPERGGPHPAIFLLMALVLRQAGRRAPLERLIALHRRHLG